MFRSQFQTKPLESINIIHILSGKRFQHKQFHFNGRRDERTQFRRIICFEKRTKNRKNEGEDAKYIPCYIYLLQYIDCPVLYAMHQQE